MDEYQLEITALRRKLAHLREADAEPDVIEEFDCELRNLIALYQATQDAFVAGETDPKVPLALQELGFGDWSFENVYNFVYEAAMDVELDGEDLATIIGHTDYAESLRRALAG